MSDLPQTECGILLAKCFAELLEVDSSLKSELIRSTLRPFERISTNHAVGKIVIQSAGTDRMQEEQEQQEEGDDGKEGINNLIVVIYLIIHMNNITSHSYI